MTPEGYKESKRKASRKYYNSNKQKVLLRKHNYWKQNKDKIQLKRGDYSKKYYKINQKRLVEQKREYHDSHRSESMAYYLRNKQRIDMKSNNYYKINQKRLRTKIYGITEKQYDDMFEKTQGNCSICHEKFGKVPHIDHNHNTGKVRGLLCSKCNTGIGFLRDSVLIMESAIKYLRDSERGL